MANMSFYQKHEKGFGRAEILLITLLALIPLFTQPSIDAVIHRRATQMDIVLTVVTLLYGVIYAAFHLYVNRCKTSAFSEKDEHIESLTAKADELSCKARQADTERRIYQKVIGTMAELARKNARMANDSVHSICLTGHTHLPERNFEQDCSNVCKSLRKTLNEYYGSEYKFEVSYIARDESSDELAVTMVGCSATDPSEAFSCNGQLRRASDQHPHFDVKLFQEHDKAGSDSPVLLLTPDQITKQFFVRKQRIGKRSCPSERKQYQQYLALPIVCPAAKGATSKKMIGLLQVAVIDARIWKRSEDARTVIGYLVTPLANQLLLVHKLENALRAVPDATTVEE